MNAEDFKSTGKNEAPKDFTARLMQEIQKEDRALESILRTHGTMETSASFVTSLQAQLDGARVRQTYKPLFSAKSWILVAIIALTFFVLPFISGTNGDSGNFPREWSSFFEGMNAVFQQYFTPSLILPIGVLFSLAFLRNSEKSRV